MRFLFDHAYLQLFFVEAGTERGVIAEVNLGLRVEVDDNIEGQGTGMEKVEWLYITIPSSRVDVGRC